MVGSPEWYTVLSFIEMKVGKPLPTPRHMKLMLNFLRSSGLQSKESLFSNVLEQLSSPSETNRIVMLLVGNSKDQEGKWLTFFFEDCMEHTKARLNVGASTIVVLYSLGQDGTVLHMGLSGKGDGVDSLIVLDELVIAFCEVWPAYGNEVMECYKTTSIRKHRLFL